MKNEQGTVRPTDLFRLKAIQEALLSPDGKNVLYSLAEVNAKEEQERVAIWCLPLKTGVSRKITSGLVRDTKPAWSPDGQQMAFLSTRGGKPQIYVISISGGEARMLTDLKQGVSSGPYWSPDGKRIAFTAGKDIEPPDPVRPYRVRRKIYRFDGMGYLGSNLLDVYVISSAGGDAKQLTDDETYNHSLAWSPDGGEILFLANFHPASHNIWPSLKTVNLNGVAVDILKNWDVVLAAAWTPDAKKIVFAGTPKNVSMETKIDLWVVDRENGQLECRTKNFNGTCSQLLLGDFPVAFQIMGGRHIFVSKDGLQAYVVMQNGGTLPIFRVALSRFESWTPVVSGEFSCTLMDMNQNQLLYSVSSHYQPLELFIADIDGGNQKQITHINQEVISQLSLPTVENLTFENPHGEQIEGWYLRPVKGEPPFPTILYIHGGPHCAFGHIFHFDFQMLCGAGYAVFFANPRGSSGYGDEFSSKLTGHWGELETEDLMTGIDLLIEKGIADPERLGVCGLSYGGFMTCYIVGQTNRFKAAVAENPITDLVSRYSTTDIGPSFSLGEMGGSPHELPEIYRRGSPITYAHKCITPTLLIQGEADYRCTAEQSEEFYAVLHAHGCIVEMLRFPGCSHLGSITGPIFVREAQNKALLDWMNSFVMGEVES